MNGFESYINTIDIDYDSEDVTFTGYVYKLNTPQFNVFKRSAYGRSTNYRKEIVEYPRQICYIPNSGTCFIKYFSKKIDQNKKISRLQFISEISIKNKDFC